MSVRPSLLQRSEVCGYVPVLAEKYPEQGEAAERGKRIHAEIVRAWMAEEQATIPEAQAAIDWILSVQRPGDTLHFERHVDLVDIGSLENVTDGTPDLVIVSQ